MPDHPPHPSVPPPPEAWEPARRAAARVFEPIERYLHVEAVSGIVLLANAVVALVWASSSWSGLYHAIWHAPIAVSVGPWSVDTSVHFVVNDVLMTIFFFVVGLEIRRELHEGELADIKRAALPVAAAIGGLITPALIYVAFTAGSPAAVGWGVPTATDIAFAVGVLAILGKRVPAALRVLLLALAIIDDLGAILLIAVFYSKGLAWSGAAVAILGLAGVIGLQRIGVRQPLWYAVPGAVTWIGVYRLGVHPTIAGVIVGLLTPVRPWFGEQGFVATAAEAIDKVRARFSNDDHDKGALLAQVKRVKLAGREALAPVVRIQAALHPWVAFGIMPLFALANAGVDLRHAGTDQPGAARTVLGVAVALVVGKPLGIFLASFGSVRLGLCVLPRGVTWTGVLLIGAVAGIGFTMAIFIAGLAFADPALLGAAKLGVLIASFTAAVAAAAIGRLLLGPVSEGAAATADEAEESAER